jgi:hypothetical protein
MAPEDPVTEWRALIDKAREQAKLVKGLTLAQILKLSSLESEQN